jgi:hypothetical protein
MTTKLIQTGNHESEQSSFTDLQIKKKLEGYIRLKNANFVTIEPGDLVRYSVNNEFRGGGRVKYVKFPTYMVCMNVIKKLSWSVQLTDPTLIIWIKTKVMIHKENIEKEKVYKNFMAGKLVPAKKK